MSKTKPTKKEKDNHQTEQEQTLKEKIDFAIFSAFIIACTIFSVVVLILWWLFGLELTAWQLVTTVLWLAFVLVNGKKYINKENMEENRK